MKKRDAKSRMMKRSKAKEAEEEQKGTVHQTKKTKDR